MVQTGARHKVCKSNCVKLVLQCSAVCPVCHRQSNVMNNSSIWHNLSATPGMATYLLAQPLCNPPVLPAYLPVQVPHLI